MAEILLYRLFFFFPFWGPWLLQTTAEINTPSKFYVQDTCMWFWGGAWLEITENIKWIQKYLYQKYIIPFCPLFHKKARLWIKPSTLEHGRTGEKGNPLDEILVLLLQQKKHQWWRLLKLLILTPKGDKTCWEWACYPEISVSGFSLYRLVCAHWEIAGRDYWGPSRTQPKSKFALAQVQNDIKTQISLFCPA